MNAATSPQTSKPVNLWFTFALICVPILIGSVDLTAIVVVLPQATLELLGPRGLERADLALWAVTAYLLAYTISLALVGRLSDSLPRKQVFLGCIVIFFLGALWAGTATGAPLEALRTLPIWSDTESLPLVSLVIGRIIQAIGAGASVSVGMALVGDIFPEAERARPIALIGALDSLGWVIGNLYAGVMLQILPSWRYLFLINAGIAVIAFLLTIWALRHHRSTRPASGVSSRFDLAGAILFGVALISLTLGVETLGKTGSSSGIQLVISAVALILFVVVQVQVKNPLFDLRFVTQKGVRAALVMNLIVGFALILMVAGVPLMINLRVVFLRGEGLLSGALQAGLMLSALTLPLVAGVIVGERRFHKVGTALPVAIGLIFTIIGFLLTLLWTYTAPTIVIAIPLAIVGAGLGLTMGPLGLEVIEAAEASRRGLASSLVLVMRLLGMTVGTPLAATLTLNMANEWASQRANNLHPLFQAIGRTMLVPPMAVGALARVLLLGAVVCAIGLTLFYLIRAAGTVRRQGIGALVGEMLPLVSTAGAVVLIAVWSSLTSPAVVENPVAYQLPSDVELYIGANIQQVFLLDSKRPLDAVVSTIEGVIALSQAPITEVVSQYTTIPDPDSGSDQGGDPDTPPVPTTEPDTPTDVIVKFLFLPRSWVQKDYAPFCPPGIPESDYQWCFNSGLLSWIGPQAAFALLPKDGSSYDYLFAFQATNRSNALKFVLALGEALRVPAPIELRPNVHLMQINEGGEDARAVAVTEAYVLIGTPGAINRTLARGSQSLAQEPDFQATMKELPTDDFATLYYQVDSLVAGLRPALLTILPADQVERVLKVGARLSPLMSDSSPETAVRAGVGLRVNETQLWLRTVAHLPIDFSPLGAVSLPPESLSLIPDTHEGWVALRLNLVGMVKGIDPSTILNSFVAQLNMPEINLLLNNPLVRAPLINLVTALQGVLLHTEGSVLISGDAQMRLIMPLIDQSPGSAAAAVARLRQVVTLLVNTTRLGGADISLLETPLPDGRDTLYTIRGGLIEARFPGGIHYALTPDNLLFVQLGGINLDAISSRFVQGGESALKRVQSTFGGTLDKFLYGYVAAPSKGDPASLIVGGSINGRTLSFDAVLDTR